MGKGSSNRRARATAARPAAKPKTRGPWGRPFRRIASGERCALGSHAEAASMAFEGVDFLRLDELLSDEERLARESVRAFVSREFLPRVQEHVRRDGSFPMELVPRIAGLGLF